jgi:hypothetical protein
MRTIEHGNEYWKLHDNGQIERTCPDGYHVAPSEQWRVVGAIRRNNFGYTVERFTLADVLENKITWRHKNGKQRVHIVDFDHGTRRVWMSPNHRVM